MSKKYKHGNKRKLMANNFIKPGANCSTITKKFPFETTINISFWKLIKQLFKF